MVSRATSVTPSDDGGWAAGGWNPRLFEVTPWLDGRQLDPGALPAAGIAPWFRIAALVVGIHSPFRFKAPKAIADVPETGDLQSASLAWAEVREEWREFVEAFPEGLNGKTIFRHPFVGLLGPAQTMIFLNEHLGNHVRQIARIRKALNA